VTVPQNQDPECFSEPRRKEIFRALVDAQDHKFSILQSRAIITRRFGVSTKQLQDIEQEGIDNDWPPL
jgi:hypothetical protein